MTESNPEQTVPFQNQPEGWQSSVPIETGERSSVSSEALRIYATVRDYHDTLQAVSGGEITELGAEADAWMAAADIAEQVERNPRRPVATHQHDLLAALEAHTATLKASALFTAEQYRTANTLGEVSAAGIILGMANERRARFTATNDPDQKVTLEREWHELREYAGMLDGEEAKFDVADIDLSVDSYEAAGNDADLKAKTDMNTKANAYYAKYVQEVIINATPALERATGLSAEEMADAKKNFQKFNINSGPSERIAKDESKDDSHAQQAEQQVLDDTRKEVETARNIEIFDDIVQLGKNHTQLYADVIGGFQPIGDGPKIENKNVFIAENINKVAARNTDWRQHLNEAVMFSEVITPQTQTVTKERVVKGRFGLSRTETYVETEAIPDSNHPVLIRNEQTGQDEPLVRFRYQFKYSELANNSGELPKYSEFNGYRSGQQIMVGLDLPKSIATKLQETMQEDPYSVRSLVEKLVLQNNNGAITEEYWRNGSTSGHPVRPPYEKLPDDWNIALVTGAETTGYKGVLSHQIKRLSTKNWAQYESLKYTHFASSNSSKIGLNVTPSIS